MEVPSHTIYKLLFLFYAYLLSSILLDQRTRKGTPKLDVPSYMVTTFRQQLIYTYILEICAEPHNRHPSEQRVKMIFLIYFLNSDTDFLLLPICWGISIHIFESVYVCRLFDCKLYHSYKLSILNTTNNISII